MILNQLVKIITYVEYNNLQQNYMGSGCSLLIYSHKIVGLNIAYTLIDS